MSELFKNTEQQLSLLEELEQQKEIALSNYNHASKNKDIAAEQMYQSEAAAMMMAIMICKKHLDAKKSDTAITEMAYKLIPVADEGCMENDIDAAKRSYVIKGAQLFRESLTKNQ